MKTLSYWLKDLKDRTIPIGFVGENLYRRVIINCEEVFSTDPDLVPALSITSPHGEKYPGIVTRDGNNVYWDIQNSDLAYKGYGEIQLAFVEYEDGLAVENGIVGRSYTGRFHVERSIIPDGDAPDEIEDFIAEASAIVAAIPQTIDDALEEAKESGEFDGADGFSPTVSITAITGGYRISITDKDGTYTADVLNGHDGHDGADGDDGFSPTVSITSITGGHRVTITDKNGDHTADIMDGVDGDPGTPGDPGQDGYSPTVSITDITGGHTVTITDKNGSHAFNVMDGVSAIDDNAGVGDTDKVWSADKSASENSLLSGALNGIEELFDIEEGGNLFNKDGEYLDNTIIKRSDGSTRSETGYGVQYIPFAGEGTYWVLFPDIYGANIQICVYNSSKTYLRTITGTGSASNPSSFDISGSNATDVAYIGYCFKKNTMSTAMAVKASTYPSEYIPYGDAKCEFLGTINADRVDDLDEAIDKRNEETKPIPTRMKFGAYEGASYYAPECTVPSYRIAGQQGWEYAWITGIDFSSENTMYVIHDSTVDRTTDGTGTLSSMTDAQINALNIDQTGEGYNLSDFDPSELKIPTFEQVVQMCVRYGMKMCIRLTIFPSSTNTEAKALKWNNFKAVLDAYNVPNSDVIFYVDSTNATMATTVRTLFGNDAEICVFLGASKTAQQGVDWFSTNSITGNRGFIINKTNVDLTAVKLLHTNGIRCYVYDSPSQEQIDTYATWGVDIVQNPRYHSITS